MPPALRFRSSVFYYKIYSRISYDLLKKQLFLNKTAFTSYLHNADPGPFVWGRKWRCKWGPSSLHSSSKMSYMRAWIQRIHLYKAVYLIVSVNKPSQFLGYQNRLLLTQSTVCSHTPEVSRSVSISVRKPDYSHVIISAANVRREVTHYGTTVGVRLSEILTLIDLKCILCSKLWRRYLLMCIINCLKLDLRTHISLKWGNLQFCIICDENKWKRYSRISELFFL
jgi:hypothetical protein